MKTIPISSRAKTINDLLKQARRGTVILESADGTRFALTSVGDWEGFEVGVGDFAGECARTVKNKKLLKSLAARKKRDTSPGTPLSDVRKQLGIDVE